MKTNDYNDISIVYDSVLWWNYEKYSNVLNLLYAKYIKNSDKISVLDIACGTWWILKYLDFKEKIEGIDISEWMIKTAQNNFPDNTFSVNSFLSLPIEKKYNFIFSIFDSLNHVSNQWDIYKIFHDVFSMLKNWGIFFFDINTLQKFKSFKSEIHQIVNNQGDYIIINREFEEPNIWKWHLDLFSKLDKFDSCYKKSTTVIEEISFDIPDLVNYLEKYFSKVILYDMKDISLDKKISVEESSWLWIFRIWILCIK